jgi:predicted lactoylglutathione lyase
LTAKRLFVNLAVKDLQKTIAFFKEIGFEFNAKFTDENAGCLILGENFCVMLLREEFFSQFTSKKIIPTAESVEVINAIQVESKAEVDAFMERVLKAGGTEPRPAEDHGSMYQRAFQDIDGHLWEVFFMEEAAA